MNILVIISLLFIELQCICCFHFRMQSLLPNPETIRINQGKVKRMVERRKQKMDKINAAKKKPLDWRHRFDYGGISKVPKEDRKYVIQLFSKSTQYDRMPWQYFDSIVADQNLRSTLDGVYNGGIAGEGSLRDLEFNISNTVYAQNNGRIFVSNTTRHKVFEVIPTLKRPRISTIVFGYKLLNGEHSGQILAINKAMTGVTEAPSHEELMREYKKKHAPVERVDPHKIILEQQETMNKLFAKQVKKKSPTLPKELIKMCPTLFTEIDTFIQSCMAANIGRLVISTDGSATISGGNCVKANCGICIMPEDNVVRKVEQSAVLKKSLYSRHIASTDATNGLSPLRFRVNGVERMIQTPFEAELLSGLTAILLSNILHKSYELLTKNIQLKSLTTQIFSDSRAFLRTTKKSGDDNQMPVNVDPFSARSIFTALLNDQLRLLDTGEGLRDVKVDVDRRCIIKWLMGHPEKRESDANRWNNYDVGMYLADDLAQPNLFKQPDQSMKYDDGSGIYSSDYYLDQLKHRFPHYFKKDVIDVSAVDIVKLSCYFDLLK